MCYGRTWEQSRSNGRCMRILSVLRLRKSCCTATSSRSTAHMSGLAGSSRSALSAYTAGQWPLVREAGGGDAVLFLRTLVYEGSCVGLNSTPTWALTTDHLLPKIWKATDTTKIRLYVLQFCKGIIDTIPVLVQMPRSSVVQNVRGVLDFSLIIVYSSLNKYSHDKATVICPGDL